MSALRRIAWVAPEEERRSLCPCSTNRKGRRLPGRNRPDTVRRKANQRMATIYKLCSAALWREAEAAGIFAGSPIDHADGYIHFSTAAQVVETAALYFRGEEDLMLVAVDAARLGPALRY